MAQLDRCVVDFETRCYKDVRKVGSWRYAEDVTAEIICLGYRIGDQPRRLWTPDLPFPQDILDHIEVGGIFEAHNAQFERAIWIFILKRKFGIPVPTRWVDTMAACAYRAIPMALDKAGAALNLPIQKDQRGKYLLQQLCMPKGPTKAEPDRIYREDLDLYFEILEYCLDDVDSEKCLGETIGDLSPGEYQIWLLDQVINQRGVQIDIDAVEAALEIIASVEETLNKELTELTDGAVTRATQRDRLLKWLNVNGLPDLENLQKETVENLLADESVIDPARRAVWIRQTLARSSTKKLTKMLQTVSGDGRIRGLLQYHGAGTGRWAGRLVQPQNFPRAMFKVVMETLIEVIRSRSPEQLEAEFGNVMEAIATALRGMFIPASGKIFRICDFSAIEARVTFWVARCQVGLDVFHTSDRGESEDIYCVTASHLVGFEVQKKLHPAERQIGKIMVLGCGYQMGAAKLQEQALTTYKVALTDQEAGDMVGLYRNKYEEVKWLWNGLNRVAIKAVKSGEPQSYNMITYQTERDAAGLWLTCTLPNGRKLWYYDPVIEKVKMPWRDDNGDEVFKDQLSYMGRDNKKGGTWGRVGTYGGMLTENVVQAISRDIMAESMLRVEHYGYPIVLTVHDEIIAEDDPDHGSQQECEDLMAIPPAWLEGCPIAVEGGMVERYQKI